MNDSFYENVDKNFQQALVMSEKEYSHQELLSMLSTGNIPQKQIAALKIDKVDNINDAQILLDNLTGCDGKIREAVAFKINKLVNADEIAANYFSKLSPKVYADASIDINANICRLIIDTIIYFKFNVDFCREYANIIMNFTTEAFAELDKFIFRDKKYVINKQIFKLYWCLEAIKYFVEYVQEDKLYNLLKKSLEQSEYTIREKAAEILIKTENFSDLKEKFSGDENYYVREVFKSS